MIRSIVFVSLLCCLVPAEAKQKINKPKKELSGVVYDFKKFNIEEIRDDIKNGKISNTYNTLPLGTVIKNLEKIIDVEPKGDYETNNDFEKRKIDAFSRKIIGDISANDLMIFSLSVENFKSYSSSSVRFNYDADDSKLSIYVFPETKTLSNIGAPDYMYSFGTELKGLDLFEIDMELNNLGEYTGANAFGRTVDVTKSQLITYGIATNHIDSIKNNRSYYYSNDEKYESFVDLSIDTKNAKDFVSDLAAMAVFRPKYPYLYFHFDSIKPTIEKPKETYYNYKYIYGDILYIVIYLKKTGEILKVLSNENSSIGNVQ